jgi:hypothetical protein
MTETMTRDPDLDAACDQLRFTASQLRGVDEKLRTMDPIKDYKFLARRGDIIAKARTLNMPWRTLLLFVEETDRLRRKHKRRPTVQMLENAFEAIQSAMDRAAIETDASIVLLQMKNAAAKDTVEAAGAGRQYMRESA